MIRIASWLVIFFCAGIILTSSTRPRVPVTDRTGVIVLRNDPGGEVYAHLKFYNRIARAHIPVRIEGECMSACTFVLKMPPQQMCVTPDASLGFHLISVNGKPDRRETKRLFPRIYPKRVLDWIHTHGPMTADIKSVKAADAIKLGWVIPCKG